MRSEWSTNLFLSLGSWSPHLSRWLVIIGERGYFDQFLLSTGLYVHLASRCPYPIIVYSLANNCRPTLVTLGGKVTTFQTQIFLFLNYIQNFLISKIPKICNVIPGNPVRKCNLIQQQITISLLLRGTPPSPPPPVITLSGFGCFSITWDKWNIPENMESKLNKKWTVNLMLT